MTIRKLIAVAIAILIPILLPLVVRNPYYLHLLILIGINSVLSMTFILMLRTGLISIGIAGFWGIGAYASALLTIKLGMPVWLAMPASTAITAVIAAILGALVVKKGGLSFVIQTLAFGFIIVLVFGTFDIFGGHVGIVNISHPEPVPVPFLGTVTFTSISKTPFYYLMLSLVLLMVLVLSAFYSAWAGRAWRAIGLSAHLAESLGINLFNYRLMAFILGSAIEGLMGSFYAHYYGALVPGSFGPFKTIYIHAYAILGGIGFPILGPVIGSFIMTFVPEFLRFTEGVEPIFTGLLIIIIILFMPNGLLGLSHYWRRKKGFTRAKYHPSTGPS